MSNWALGIVVTTSGLGKEDKNRVQRTVKDAGGDYSPNLSKRCTHVLTVEGKRSEKLDAIRSNPATWPQAIVHLEWLSACSRSGAPLPPESFPVTSQQVPEARRPLAARQEPAASHASRSLFGSRATDDSSLAAAQATRSAAGAAPPSGAPGGRPWVLDAHVKPEPLGTATKPPTGPAALPAALTVAAPPPAAVTTAHKPWRVHFSQVEEDPFAPPPTTHAHAQAAADAARRPWRVRVSSVPEGEDDGGAGGAAAAAGEGEGQDAAGAMQAVEEDDEDEGAARAAGLGAAALPPAKPWLVRHMDLSVDDEEARRARAQPPPPVVRVHMQSEPEASLDTANTTRRSGTAELVRRAAKASDCGTDAGGEVRHPSAIALLEALQSSQESGAASTASARGAAAAAAAGAGAGPAAPGHSHRGFPQQDADGHGRSGAGGRGAGLDGRDGDGGFEPSFTQLAADLQALRADFDTSSRAPPPPSPPRTGAARQAQAAALGLAGAPARPAMSPSVSGRNWDSRPELQPQRSPGAVGPWARGQLPGPAPMAGREEPEEEGRPSWGAGPGLSQLVAELREARAGLGEGRDPDAAHPTAAADSGLRAGAGAAAHGPPGAVREEQDDGDGEARGVHLSQGEYGPGRGLSQLVAELRDARQGLGGRGVSSGGGGSGDRDGADEPKPALLAIAGGAPSAPRLWSPPRGVLWGRGCPQPALDAGRTSPPRVVQQHQPDHRHQHQHQPIDDVNELEMEDGEAAEPCPGPLTQLIQGLQEARQGLQAGAGVGPGAGLGGGWQLEAPERQQQDRSSLLPSPPLDAWDRHGERQDQRRLALPGAPSPTGGDKQQQQQQQQQQQATSRAPDWALPPLGDTEDQDQAMADTYPHHLHPLAAGGAGPWVDGEAGPAPGPSLSQLVDSMRQARQGLAGATAGQRDVVQPAGDNAKAAAGASPGPVQPWSIHSRGAAAAQQPQQQPSPLQQSPTRPRAQSPSHQHPSSHRPQTCVAANMEQGEDKGSHAGPRPAGAADDTVSFSQLIRLMQRQKINRQEAEQAQGQKHLQEEKEHMEVVTAGEAAAEEEDAEQAAAEAEEADDGDDGADSDGTLEPPPSQRLSLDLGQLMPAQGGSAGTFQGETLRVKPEVASPGVRPGPLGLCGSPAVERSPPQEPAAMEWEPRQQASPQPASPQHELGYTAVSTGRTTPRTQPQQVSHSCAAGVAAADGTGSDRPDAARTEGGLASSPLSGRIASAMAAAVALPLPWSQRPESEPDPDGTAAPGDARGSDISEPQSHSQGRSRAAQGLHVVVPGMAVAAAGPSPVLRPVSLWTRLGPEASPQSPAAGLSMRHGIKTPTAAAGAASSFTRGSEEDAHTDTGGFGGFHVPLASQGAATTAGLRSPLPTAGGAPALWSVAGTGDDGAAGDMETGTPYAARTPAPAASGQELSFGFGVGLGELAGVNPDTPASVRGGYGRTPARATAGAAAAAAAAAAGPLGRCSGKAAARKMDSRTPSLLSTQGKHKRREVRDTPAAMRGPQPLLAPRSPVLWPEGSQPLCVGLDSGAGLAAVASLQLGAAKQSSQAQAVSAAPSATSQDSAAHATSSQGTRRSQQGQPASHSQGLALLLVGSQQQGSLQAGGGSGGGSSLPQLGLEEVMQRRAHMPWARATAGTGVPAAIGGTGTATAAAPTARAAALGWQGVCASPMPITPGPWAAPGQESDADDDVDEAAMLAAGRAAAAARVAVAVGGKGGAAGLGIALVPAMTAGAVQLGGRSSAAAAALSTDPGEAGAVAAAGTGTGMALPELPQASSDDSQSPSNSGSEDDDSQPPIFNLARGRSQLRRDQPTAVRQQVAPAVAAPAAAAAPAPIAPSRATARPAAAVARAAMLALPPGTESQSQQDTSEAPEVHENAVPDQPRQQPHAAVSDAMRALGSLELREADAWCGGSAEATGAGDASPPQGIEQDQQQLHGSLPQMIAGDGGASGGLLAGAAVIIDRCLGQEVATRCAAAVAGLGGHVSTASHLGCGAAAVVCEPSRAPRWMAWGAHLLSPRSLTRLAGQDLDSACEPIDPVAVASAAASSLICLSRGVASAVTETCCQRDGGNSHPDVDVSGAARGTGSTAGAPPAGPAAAASDGAAGAAGPWSSRASRRQLVIDLKAAEDSTAAGKLLGMRGQAAAAHLRKPPAAPPSLLDHLVWNVSQPPEAAQTLAPPADCGGCNEPAGEPAEDAWGYGGSQGSLDEGPAGLACIAPASQLQEPRAVEQRELDAVVYAGRRLTLLLPQDRFGILGHNSHTVVSPATLPLQPLHGGATGGGGGGGITLRALLTAVQRHYEQPLSNDEMVEAMAGHPDLRRALQVAWQKVQAPPRSALLGQAAVLVGMRRCGQSGSLPVYELQLAQ
ncbi:hypothetical protein CHLRE_10g440500v5 [Chlamydomonas reinhardtii]|uniref:BRCT domain-containing protein n=1 Tax=Chlamydomonas reinhardtii TaxID=3055 RepID=A0A2K3DAG0_CHLRE|nr:uncharacterized protein CHLRE_10g440500v5 [Chlamydomonas reinhardtii]PNW77525.1 hypothetical protein CHLRE_10g440500v5 [Chlamydomonas reinhardtii]